MNLTNLTIQDLFTKDAKLTFLVGAGCSVDAPSCLAAGQFFYFYLCLRRIIETD